MAEAKPLSASIRSLGAKLTGRRFPRLGRRPSFVIRWRIAPSLRFNCLPIAAGCISQVSSVRSVCSSSEVHSGLAIRGIRTVILSSPSAPALQVGVNRRPSPFFLRSFTNDFDSLIQKADCDGRERQLQSQLSIFLKLQQTFVNARSSSVAPNGALLLNSHSCPPDPPGIQTQPKGGGKGRRTELPKGCASSFVEAGTIGRGASPVWVSPKSRRRVA